VSAVAFDRAARFGQPSWLRLFWEVVLAYVFAFAVLGVLALAATGLGIWNRTGIMASAPGGLDDVPFVRNGGWSLAANIAWSVVAIGVTAVFVYGFLGRFGRLSLGQTLFAVAVAGVPLTDYPSLGSLGFLATPIALSALARWDLLGPPGAWERARPATRGTIRLVVVAVAVAALAVVAGYGIVHPLRLSSSAGGFGFSGVVEQQDWGGGPVLVYEDESVPLYHRFALDNSGWRDVTVTSLTAEAVGTSLRIGRAVVAADGSSLDAARPVEGLRLPRRSTTWVALELHPAACSEAGRDVLERVLVRYRAYGREWTQAVPLIPAPARVAPSC
jgi:hypothetical protein